MFMPSLVLKTIIFIGVLENLVEAKITVYSEKGLFLEEFLEKANSKIPLPAFFNLYKKGVIHIGDPVDGCSPVRNTSGFDQSLNHFVLIDANGCPFETKVLNVQDGGHSAVLVSRSKNSTPVNADRFVSDVPVLLVTEVDFGKISDNYVFSVNRNYRVTVTVGELEVALSVSLAFVSMCFIVFLVYYAGGKVIRNLRRRGIIGVSSYKRGNSVQICSICQVNLEEGEIYAELMSCLHVFHRQCIQRWIDSSNNEAASNEGPKCPNCRQDVKGSRELTVPVVPTERTPLLRNITINGN